MTCTHTFPSLLDLHLHHVRPISPGVYCRVRPRDENVCTETRDRRRRKAQTVLQSLVNLL